MGQSEKMPRIKIKMKGFRWFDSSIKLRWVMVVVIGIVSCAVVNSQDSAGGNEAYFPNGPQGENNVASYLAQVSSSVVPPQAQQVKSLSAPGEAAAAAAPETADQEPEEEAEEGGHYEGGEGEGSDDEQNEEEGGSREHQDGEESEEGGDDEEGGHEGENSEDDEQYDESEDSEQGGEARKEGGDGEAQESRSLFQYALPQGRSDSLIAAASSISPVSVQSFLNFSNAISSLTHSNLSEPLSASESSIVARTATGDLDTAATGYGGHGHG